MRLQSNNPGRPIGLRNLLWLLLLSVLWGSSFLFVKIAVTEVPPFTLVASSMTASAVMLYPILRISGGRLPRDPQRWRHLAVLALVGTALPFIFLSWGQQHVDSAIAGILDATMPLFTLVLAHFFIEADRMSRRKVLGVSFGLVGAIVLIDPLSQSGFEISPLGVSAVTMCAFFYAVAAVYGKLRVPGMVPLSAPTMQFGISALYLIPLSLVFDRPWLLEAPSATVIWAWLGLVCLGTVAAFTVYYHLLEQVPVVYLSMVTYLAPIVALVLGVSVLDESLHWNAYLGGIAILAGLLVINGVPRRPKLIDKDVDNSSRDSSRQSS